MARFAADGNGLAAEYERVAEVTSALYAAMEEVRVTMDSADGLVTVVTGGRGEVLELELDPRIFQTPDSVRLAKTILETIRAAHEEAADESRRLLEKVKNSSDNRMRPMLEGIQDAWDPDPIRR